MKCLNQTCNRTLEESNYNSESFCSKKCSRSYAVAKRRRLLKSMALQLKGNQCEICGYNKTHWALEFHHKDPSEKDFAIGSKGYTFSWEKVKSEVEKCILVCSNCHREIHAGLIELSVP